MNASKLTKYQRITKQRAYSENGVRHLATLTLRYDDECGNGHNSFAATVWDKEQCDNERWIDAGGGADHELIARIFPEYEKYLKWHLMSSDGPMHYIANTMYHAGDADYRGLRKGERRQLRNGKTGLPVWAYVAVNIETGEETELDTIRDMIRSESIPECKYTLAIRPVWINGEGKERDLDAARSTAIWPEATDDDLTAPGLRERLEARLPALMDAFRCAMEELGFIY